MDKNNGKIYTDRIAEALFEDVPSSAGSERAKAEISSALLEEYVRAGEGHTEIEALGHIMSRYGSLEAAAALAGYSADDAAAWRSPENALDLSGVKKGFSRARVNIYLMAFFMAETFEYICSFIIFKKPMALAFIAAEAGLAGLFYAKIRRGRREYGLPQGSCLPEARNYLRAMSDRYGKRLINGGALSLCLLVFLLFSAAGTLLSSPMKPEELGQIVFEYSRALSLGIFIMIKNIMCRALADGQLRGGTGAEYKAHLKRLAAASVIYWLAVSLAAAALRSRLDNPLNVIIFASVIYFIAMLAYNLTLRKDIVFKNITLNKRRAAITAAALTLAAAYQLMQLDSWFIQPYISTVSTVGGARGDIEYDEETGVYTITAPDDDFKILQLTDIHLGGSAFSARKDLKALRAVYNLIEHTRPDLVVVTGDLVFPMGIMSFSINNYTPVMQFASFMRNVGVPWAFVYGNHDTETMATSSAEDLNSLFKSVSYKSSKNLLYPYIQPDVTGRNNQLIEIKNQDGSLRQALFLLDSNSYTGGGLNDYDYIHDDQVEWYERNVARLSSREGRMAPSMLFFHIPLQQYREAYKLYESGSGEVKYFFGENGETMIDKVCCSDHPSRLFDAAERLGSTKAMFCGHDHYNNLSVEYRGVRLTYGMSIDYLAMPGIEDDAAQRGGTLVTLAPDSSFGIEQIPLSDIEQ